MTTKARFLISSTHWTIETFKERITTAQWKELLLGNNDKIIVSGNVRQLVAKRLGYGVVEIFKSPLKEEKP